MMHQRTVKTRSSRRSTPLNGLPIERVWRLPTTCSPLCTEEAHWPDEKATRSIEVRSVASFTSLRTEEIFFFGCLFCVSDQHQKGNEYKCACNQCVPSDDRNDDVPHFQILERCVLLQLIVSMVVNVEDHTFPEARKRATETR